MNNNVQIMRIEAKDLIGGKVTITTGLSDHKKQELKEEGFKCINRYKGSMDYSLLTIHIKKNYKNVIKLNEDVKRFFSNDFVTVKFKYSYNGIINNVQYNSLIYILEERKEEKGNLYKIKDALKKEKSNLDEKDNKRKDINKKMHEINNEIKRCKAKMKSIIDQLKDIKDEYIIDTKELRNRLYRDGFTINVNGKETRFIRLYRSSGSARVGKINFVNEKYYEKLIEWLMAGIDYKNRSDLDLPSLEAYTSLVTSSIINTFKLKPENILLIDDKKPSFTNTVMATELLEVKDNAGNAVKDKKGNIVKELHTDVAEKEIFNNLFDGESLLSKEVFIENGYEDKAVLQLRNIFYKGIGINTDIQKFFDNNGIKSIEQLKAVKGNITLATDINQIKLITTKSSIKYMKYKSFKDWISIMQDTWGICKYDKGQEHNFNGMASTHYQLLNTLGMSKDNMKELLKDTIDYIKLLKNDISVFKLHLGLVKDESLEDIDLDELNEDEVQELDSFKTNAEFILQMLNINEDFAKTKICRNFKYETIKNYIKNVKKGHVLVNGTYAVVINSAYEYLLASIGKYEDKSETLGIGECFTAKFNEGEDVLGVRSPQPTMSNMTVFENVQAGKLADYFNVKSENVIYISAIGWNIMELESSMDFDGDAMLITNLKSITHHCKKLNEKINVKGKEINRFLVSTDFTPKKSIPRNYTPKDLSGTDIKCSQGKIGECINLVQMLNSVYWDKKYKGASEEELLEFYKDISNLNVLSCIIIDSAKKESSVNVQGEMNKIRAKNYLGKVTIIKDGKDKEIGIRPYFFKYLDGGKDYKFKKFHTGMDYLAEIMEKVDRKNRDDENGNVTIKSLLIKQTGCNYRKGIDNIVDLIKQMQIEVSNIYQSKDENTDKFRQAEDIRQDYESKIRKIKITPEMIYTILRRMDIGEKDKNSKFAEYTKIGRNLLRTLYKIHKNNFLKCFMIKTNITLSIVKAEDGNINIYGVKFKKIKRK